MFNKDKKGNNQKGKLSVSTLVVMNIVAVVSLRGLPAEAEYGLSSIFYYLFAAVFFLIPVALVAAELATGWPEKGGIFRWVGEAFGPKLGFIAMVVMWIETTVWFPATLTFGAVSIAFIEPNQLIAESISNNKFFILFIVLAMFWIATFISLRGLSSLTKVAKWSGIFGTIVPAAFLIVLGFAYYIAGNTPEIPLAFDDIIPNFSDFSNIVLAASIFLFYAGMEMNAIHVKEIDNPTQNYPKAIILAAIGTVTIFVLGTLAIAFVIPRSDISLTQSLLITYYDIFKWAGLEWMSSVVAIMLSFGVFAGIITWIAGPSAGLLEVAKAGYLPRWFQKVNKNNMPANILFMQALLVTALSSFLIILPSVQAAYQILNQLAVILYLTIYLLMFSSGIYLRYSQKDRPRPYAIPGGRKGMLIIAGMGFIGSLIAFIFSFIPPAQIAIGNAYTFVGSLVLLTLMFIFIPNYIFNHRKDSWQDPDSDFAPLSTQKGK